jgi:heme-degrading monooxygenase HmoA
MIRATEWVHLREVKAVFFNTEVFEVSDVDRFKEVMMSFRESLEASGGSEVRVFRNVDKPNQVFSTMWWPSVEACHTWARENGEEVMKAAEGIVTNMEPEFLWEEL